MTGQPGSTGGGGLLAGFRVLDVTQALAGPFATYLLGALGAEVIKVEAPGTGEMARRNPPFLGPQGLSMTPRSEQDVSLTILNRSRGKLGVTLDLKQPEGLQLFLELARHSHVVVENFSSGTADRLGIGYAAVRAVNERIVYCAISGFGADRALGKGCMDSVAQGLSGAMLAGGKAGDAPHRAGFPLADTIAPLFAVIGICSALVRAEQAGVGEFIDVSMLGALTALVATEDWHAMQALGQPMRTGRTLPRIAPFGVYQCSDGYVSIVAPSDASAHRLFRLIGRAELVERPEFATLAARAQRDPEITALIEQWTAGRTAQEAAALLAAEGIPSAPVRTPLQAVVDPDVLERGEVTQAIHPTLGPIPELWTTGMPIRFGRQPPQSNRPAPQLGEHNEAVFAGLLGLDAARLAELRRLGVIA